MNCDYCPDPAVWYATAESATAGMTRLACRSHVDRARRDCSIVGPPSVLEIADRPWSQLAEGSRV